jgi:hypothetical protein
MITRIPPSSQPGRDALSAVAGTVSAMSTAYADELSEQLSWHWEFQLRPRLDGLTDEEYLWEPVPGAWNVHPRGEGNAAGQYGSGPYVIDFEFPEPKPAPVTTIAWRLGHILVGIFGDRNARHFGGRPVDYQTYAYPGTAEGALAELDAGYDTWIKGVRGLSDDALAEPCGEPGYEQDPMSALVLHINREVIHHGAEISLLRDLYLHQAV